MEEIKLYFVSDCYNGDDWFIFARSWEEAEEFYKIDNDDLEDFQIDTDFIFNDYAINHSMLPNKEFPCWAYIEDLRKLNVVEIISEEQPRKVKINNKFYLEGNSDAEFFKLPEVIELKYKFENSNSN